MLELPLIFLGGLLGSSHCIGMCGGFALLIGMGTKNVRNNLKAQSVYSLGRVFTYTVLGAIAGYCGGRLSGTFNTWVNVPAVLSLLAGMFLIVQGLLAAGIRIGIKKSSPAHSGCLTGSLFATFMRSPGLLNRFLAGLLTGLLPCGLVYAFLSMSAATTDVTLGGLLMFAFGLGTVPLMVITGVGGNLMSLVARKRLLYIAAWCVVGTGVLTMARGAGFLSLPGSSQQPACPFCVQADALPGSEVQ